ncbi:MAG: transketolase family protein [Planctomycetes bacterium]|nr:transketolase family protein [Planctomycetota bacterium]
MAEMKCTREACGSALVELGKINPNVVVLSADLAGSTKTSDFQKAFPDRFFNMGIAEANMMNTAAGLAFSGKIAFATTFAIFATGRPWEQIRNTIAYTKANVKIVATHGGVAVGPDGASHQGIEDIALMRVIPGMTVIIPCDAVETPKAIFAAAQIKGPVYIRLSRPKLAVITNQTDYFKVGGTNILREGNDVTIIACGIMVAKALEAADALKAQNISATVVNLHTIKPLDNDSIISLAKKTGAVVTAEEHLVAGGMGSAVAELLSRNHPVPIEMVGINDRFGQSGESDELLKYYHLTAEDIVGAAKKAISRKRTQ